MSTTWPEIIDGNSSQRADLPPLDGGGGATDPEIVRDTIAAALVAGTNVTIIPDDSGDTIEISSTGGGATDPEIVRDVIAAALVAGANVTITPDDPNDTITISATDTDTTDPEVVRDTIATALVAGTNVTITPDDVGNTITISATDTDTNTTDPEVVRDTMAAALVAGALVTITPDDGADTITIAVSGAARDTLGGNEISSGFAGTTGSIAIDGSAASLFYNANNLTGNITLDCTNFVSAGKARTFTIIISHNATPRTVGFSTIAPVWINNGGSAVASVANKRTIYHILSLGDGASTVLGWSEVAA